MVGQVAHSSGGRWFCHAVILEHPLMAREGCHKHSGAKWGEPVFVGHSMLTPSLGYSGWFAWGYAGGENVPFRHRFLA